MSCGTAGAGGKVTAAGDGAAAFSSFAISLVVVACAVVNSGRSGSVAPCFGLAATTTGSACVFDGSAGAALACQVGSGNSCVTRSGQMVFATGLAGVGRAGGGVHVVLHPSVHAARKNNHA